MPLNSAYLPRTQLQLEVHCTPRSSDSPKYHESDSMTELEEAELYLRRARAQRQWAARQNDYELEQALARESHRCWVEVELLKARVA